VHRVLIAEKNRLLREMLTRALKTVTHLEIVYPTRPPEHWSEEIEQFEVDWVIVSSENGENLPVGLIETLAAHPHIGVLEVARDGSPVRVRRLEIVEYAVGEISLDELGEILAHDVSELDQYVERKETVTDES